MMPVSKPDWLRSNAPCSDTDGQNEEDHQGQNLDSRRCQQSFTTGTVDLQRKPKLHFSIGQNSQVG